MSNEKEIDSEYTSNVICPYCGYEDDESYSYLNEKWEDDDIEIQCLDCHKEFSMSFQKDVTYSTFKVNGTKEERDRIIEDVRIQLYKKYKQAEDPTGDAFRKFCNEYDDFKKQAMNKYFKGE